MAVALIATFTIKEGSAYAFEKVVADLAGKVLAAEPGVRLYQLTRSRHEPATYKMLELYEDQQAYDAHGGTNHMAAARGDLIACLAKVPSLEFLDTV